jgi:hypothetical protein
VEISGHEMLRNMESFQEAILKEDLGREIY